MSKALVFSIEESSTFDGPGLRSTVFLKGCSLACEWCHNPEGQSFENQIIKAQSGCEGCGACMREGKITEKSIKVCPNRLLRLCAAEYTPEELVAKLEKNIPILNGGHGGITFSGGEPLSHPRFLCECLSLLENKTHLALPTRCKSTDRSRNFLRKESTKTAETGVSLVFRPSLSFGRCYASRAAVTSKPTLAL